MAQLKQNLDSLELKSCAASQQIETEHEKLHRVKLEIMKENAEVERLARQKYQKILVVERADDVIKSLTQQKMKLVSEVMK